MGGSITGAAFRVCTFGESHGAATGCVIDGCPAGLPLCEADINAALARRRPGAGGAATTRREADECEILSGVFEGATLGTPLAIIIRNGGARSSDYDALKEVYRPGHADKAWEDKYGRRDYRGGGRSSGRETAARVAAGAVARRLLLREGVRIDAWVSSIGEVSAPAPDEDGFSLEEAARNPLVMPGAQAAKEAAALIERLRESGDSIGGVVSCRVSGLAPGWGEPVFGKLDAALAAAVMSIGAVKGVEIGAGFAAARLTGSQNNDTFLPGGQEDAPNKAGGVLGGISTGLPLVFRAAFKPVPSISRRQETVDRQGRPCRIAIAGRHDVCVCPRAVPVVEAMTALTLADLFLLQRLSRL